MIVGAGNVASHLAVAFKDCLVGIVNRSGASELARTCGTESYSDFAIIARKRPDIVLVSVADHALPEVVDSIGALNYAPLVLHTSGTVPKEVLKPISNRTGILYPLQTFSKGCDVDMRQVPLFTDANTEPDLEIVDNLAHSISDSVHHADGPHRKLLHMAGVFTSNFTNILLESVERILSEGGYGLDTVRPLLEATVDKAFKVGPHAAQTGPARRRDFAVIEEHKRALPADLSEVYDALTRLILKSHSSNEQN